MGTITTREACRRLGVSHHTFLRWAKLLQIEPITHPYDKRYRFIDEDDLDRLRQARADLFASASVVPVGPPVLLEPLSSTPAAPRPVQRAPGARSRVGHSAGHHPPLPDGWVAWIRLSEELDIPGTSARRFTAEHIIPFEEGIWDSGVANRPYRHALSPDQQITARQIISARRDGNRDAGEVQEAEQDA